MTSLLVKDVSEINRFSTPKTTITRLNYVPALKSLLISESSMFGFDWTGRTQSISASELLTPRDKNITDIYSMLPWSTVEYEHGCATTEYFALSAINSHLLVAGCTDGALYSLKLSADQSAKKSYKLPVFKYYCRRVSHIKKIELRLRIKKLKVLMDLMKRYCTNIQTSSAESLEIHGFLHFSAQ